MKGGRKWTYLVTPDPSCDQRQRENKRAKIQNEMNETSNIYSSSKNLTSDVE